MTYLMLFAVLAVLLALRNAPGFRLLASVALVPVAYLAVTEPLSQPKPMRIEFLRSLDKAEVSYFEASETEGIYIVTGRRAYVTPWSESLARQLHEGMRKVEGEGGTLRLMIDGTQGGEPSAGWTPPPPLPPKD